MWLREEVHAAPPFWIRMAAKIFTLSYSWFVPWCTLCSLQPYMGIAVISLVADGRGTERGQ